MPTVMIAEDDLLMADMLEETLVTAGYDVCGIARTVGQAVELGERYDPDLAVVDIRLADGGLGTDIPARLKSPRRMGVLFASGYVTRMDLKKADGDAVISKPYRADGVIRALKIVEQVVAINNGLPPFPEGFALLDGPNNQMLQTAESEEVIKLRRQQAALAGFGSFALGERDLSKVLAEAARVCADGLEVPYCKVCRYRSDENDLLVEAGVGWHEGVIGRVVSRADETSPQGRAFTTGEPVICDDLSQDATFVLPPFYAEHGIVSTVDVVIKKEGNPYGVLEIDSPTRQNYDGNDINFLTGFANVLAEAVNTGKRNAAMQDAVDRMQEMVADKDRLLVAKSAIVEEKAVLARELQHRVRNNLHLVQGMLAKQIEASTDLASVEGMGAIARRVMTLAQVYEHLLGTGLSRTIDSGKYLTALCSNIAAMEKSEGKNIGLTCHCESLMLDLDIVTALGLAASELVANCYAHAFPSGVGSVSLSLTTDTDHSGKNARLTLSDDGVGFVDADGSKRHGLGLVRRLAEQIGGSATVISDRGTEWNLTFPVPKEALVPV
jgi:two-component sensor histidine kinase/DNA-binding NarL/FixJ family response regulator